MNWSPTPFILTLLATTILGSALALHAWRQRHAALGLQMFMLVMISTTIWTLATAMQSIVTTLPMKLVWMNIQIIGVATAPTLWLIFVFEYSGQDKHLPSTYKRYLSIIPLLIIALAWTNDSHHLLIIDASLLPINGILALQIQPGLLHLLYALYSYLLLLVTSFTLLQIIRDKTNLYRMQAIALLTASLLPWGASVIDVFAWDRVTTFTMPPLAFFISSLILIGAFYRLQLLNIVPVARETIIENMTDGVIVVDKAGRIADINPAAALILNQPVSSLLGQSVGKAFSGQATLTYNYQASTAHRSEIVRQAGDGTPHYYEMKISELWNGRKKLDGQLIVLHDVTERKNTARALTNAKVSAETASQIKNEFLANMSHELRTPLNSIIGYTDLTLMGTYGALSNQQQDRLEKVAVNARHLLQLINDILDISRIETDQLLLHLEQVELSRILQDCVATMQPAVIDMPVEIVLDIPEQLPSIITDARRFKQIMINLLANAIKFTPEGTVTLKAHILNGPTAAVTTQHIPTQIAPPWVFLQVIDTGIGIAPEDQPLVFEDFRQVDGSSTRKYQGSGVGLTITRRLVKRMKGSIWVESVVGSGSTMNVLLPVNLEQHSNNPQSALEQPQAIK